MNTFVRYLFLLFLSTGSLSYAKGISGLVPKPAEYTAHPGVFELNANTRILYASPPQRAIAELCAAALRPASGFSLPVGTMVPSSSHSDTLL